MTLKRNILLAGAVLMASAGLAQAEMMATTVNDLNVRAGPGPQYPSVGLATRGSTAVLDGCIEGSRWCRVDVNGMRGWVYADYLQVDHGGSSVIVEQHRSEIGVPSVTYEFDRECRSGRAAAGAGRRVARPRRVGRDYHPAGDGSHLYRHQSG